jgi:hypothetical protein
LLEGCGPCTISDSYGEPTETAFISPGGSSVPRCDGLRGAIGTSSVSISHNEWTWVSGSNEVNEPGTYGTEGTSSVGDTPGARVYADSRTGSSGNLWLFGGYGFASAGGTEGDLIDLWEYTDGKWVWVSGSNGTEQAGSYGTLGVPSAVAISVYQDSGARKPTKPSCVATTMHVELVSLCT